MTSPARLTRAVDQPAGPQPELPPEPAPTGWARAGLWLKIGVAVSFAGVTVLRPALPANTAFVDPIIAVICLVALMMMMHRGSPATQAAVRCMPWLWLILLGSLGGLAGVGITGWAVQDLLVSYFAFLSFFCFWHVMYVARLERYAVYGTAVGMGIVCFALLSGSAVTRQAAYFAQPNYPAHYMVLAVAVMLYYCRSWWARSLILLALAITIWETGSFGSVVMCGSLLAVVAWRSLSRNTAFLAIGLIVLLLGTLFVASGGEAASTRNGFNFSSSLNSNRFNRSSKGRYALWNQGADSLRQHPFGVGPNGDKSRALVQEDGTPILIHNDALSYLVERGPVGFIGLIGLWIVLWMLAKRKGAARLCIVTIVVASMFRQTMHYRHLWLFLAMAFVYDWRQADQAQDELAAGSEADGGPDGLAPGSGGQLAPAT